MHTGQMEPLLIVVFGAAVLEKFYPSVISNNEKHCFSPFGVLSVQLNVGQDVQRVVEIFFFFFQDTLISGLKSEVDDWPPEDISRLCGSVSRGGSWVQLEANTVHTLLIPSSVFQLLSKPWSCLRRDVAASWLKTSGQVVRMPVQRD